MLGRRSPLRKIVAVFVIANASVIGVSGVAATVTSSAAAAATKHKTTTKGTNTFFLSGDVSATLKLGKTGCQDGFLADRTFEFELSPSGKVENSIDDLDFNVPHAGTTKITDANSTTSLTYAPNAASTQLADSWSLNASGAGGSGTVTVSTDGHVGSIDVTLLPLARGAKSDEHISGSWSCSTSH